MSFQNRFIAILLILLFTSSPLLSQHKKKLTITGLRLFTEAELYSELHLDRYEKGKITLNGVISSIENFYRDKNYTLVKVYKSVAPAGGGSVLFVDEGRIGKIIVHNLNNYYSLKFKQQINIPGRIYNSAVMNQTMEKLLVKFPGSSIRTELQNPPDYEGNLIQLDRELQRLKLGEIVDITFFER